MSGWPARARVHPPDSERSVSASEIDESGWVSEEALALKSNINRTYIGSLESCARNPSLENIVRLALVFELDPADLVRGLHKIPGRD